MFTGKTEITAKDIKQLLLRVYLRYKAGEISEQKALRETNILAGILKAIEVTDTENRLQKIEEALRNA